MRQRMFSRSARVVLVFLSLAALSGAALAQGASCTTEVPKEPVCSFFPSHPGPPECPTIGEQEYEYLCEQIIGACFIEEGCYPTWYRDCLLQPNSCCNNPGFGCITCNYPLDPEPADHVPPCYCEIGLLSCWKFAELEATCYDSVNERWVYTFTICFADCKSNPDVDWNICVEGTEVKTEIIAESDDTICIAAEGPGTLTVAPDVYEKKTCAYTEYFVEVQVDVPAPTCTGDLDGDGQVNVTDQFILLADWGDCAKGEPCEGCCEGDLNGTGTVDVNDLFILLAAWGTCP